MNFLERIVVSIGGVKEGATLDSFDGWSHRVPSNFWTDAKKLYGDCENVLQSHSIGFRISFIIQLGVDEALKNLFKHGWRLARNAQGTAYDYLDPSLSVSVRATIARHRGIVFFILRVPDFTRPFDLPKINPDLEESYQRGLGIFTSMGGKIIQQESSGGKIVTFSYKEKQES